jgi:hypothetical protein
VKSKDGANRKKRKLYEKPTVTKLNPEEAKAKLQHLADQGHEQAKEMLRLMDSGEHRGPGHRKKSA